MLLTFLHSGYRKAITARLNGRGDDLVVPEGGRTAKRFNQALFTLIGRLARLDGQVTPRVIEHSTRIMGLLGLDPVGRSLAVEYFNQGKSPGTDLAPVVERLVEGIGRRNDLTRLFLKTLSDSAKLDGGIGLQQRILLRDVAETLGYSKPEFESICLGTIPYGEYGPHTICSRIDDAYHVLQLSPGVGEGEIRKAYLRLVSRHHPDKLATQDRSEEALRLAEERFASIRNAYEVLRGMHKVRA
jgi:DnaJ like chaperone protein